MLDGYKIVVVTPAGRKRYLELLIPQIKTLRSVVDEYRLWVNTYDKSDIAYMQSEAAKDPGFIKLDYLPDDAPKQFGYSIFNFFPNCVDLETIYVRFDDDVVMIDDINAFINMIRYRINNPQYFLVYGTILNNAICSNLLQNAKLLDIPGQKSGYSCLDEIGWSNPHYCKALHEDVLKRKDLAHYRLKEPWVLKDKERVSINNICWLGSRFATFGGKVGQDEEEWLACTAPTILNKNNVIFNGFACVHYAFGPQREYIDSSTDILERYKDWCIESLYYKRLFGAADWILNADVKELEDISKLTNMLSSAGLFYDDRKSPNDSSKSIYGDDSVYMLDQPNPSYGIWQTPVQLARYLLFLKDKQVKTYLDIGTFSGWTIALVACFLKRFGLEHVDTVDVYNNMNNQVKQFLKAKNLNVNCWTLPIEKSQLLKKYDVVFVDGDNETGVYTDFDEWRDSARMVAIHNINDHFCQNVRICWYAIKRMCVNKAEFYEFCDHPNGFNLMGIGIAVFNKI